MFTIEVLPRTQTITAPRLSIGKTSYSIPQGGGTVTTDCTLTGTEPFSTSLQAYSIEGRPAYGFGAGSTINTIIVSPDVGPREYTLTLTAENEAGASSVSFTIIVTGR